MLRCACIQIYEILWDEVSSQHLLATNQLWNFKFYIYEVAFVLGKFRNWVEIKVIISNFLLEHHTYILNAVSLVFPFSLSSF